MYLSNLANTVPPNIEPCRTLADRVHGEKVALAFAARRHYLWGNRKDLP